MGSKNSLGSRTIWSLVTTHSKLLDIEDQGTEFCLRKLKFNMIYNTYLNKSPFKSGWDETNFLGRDRDREIRLMKIHYETETEKKWMLIF